MKCRKCKNLSLEEKISHFKETHGISFIMFKKLYPELEIDWDIVEEIYAKHKETGKQGEFKDKFKY